MIDRQLTLRREPCKADVDQLYAELSRRGARLIKQPQDRDYGMRDFDVVDVDGNQLTFGMGTDASS
ncbi:hypothetical protein AYJ54_25420 [Bradyrhizobium centrolobii]|uniref:VOC domain-containing protein n=1 Tax=Bradyrhizobium centrolobii TaxID=1505087 RepID=A0A176YEQ2_9BRAD|nr:hypothetical protein [Bradyrhizobium centrolobii]OAF02946.1 hypothetical protein AYJ54_25420 [Bradyrhizobium centrolobii]